MVGERGDVQAGVAHRGVRPARVTGGVGKLRVVVQVRVRDPLTAAEARQTSVPTIGSSGRASAVPGIIASAAAAAPALSTVRRSTA
ncbi:hypothetical protein GCM10011354_35900 [Egicoccus halophilus]|uniref:Uncharacterized protein n=1 Tax=Egicoccus halophilus TaxID=1670830 RepID=A0A8J3ADN3_9ACTN|nr:hypothetical protein GCM10011354_35900 [Egicoccus halophilus]